MTFVFTILKLIIVLGVVATIHEMGHFLFAKLFKMKVDEFGIGFGKAIIKKEYKGTVYSLRWIPLGGFVSIDGEDGGSLDANAFTTKSPWKRIVVVLMGATFNAILACSIFLGVNFQSDTYTTKIVTLEPNSIMQTAGIKPGDTITKIGNTNTNVYEDIALFKDYSKKDIKVEYIRAGKLESLILESAVLEKGYAGIYFDTSKTNSLGETLTVIEVVEPGYPAAKVKMKTGDIILEVNKVSVNTAREVIALTSENANKELSFVILRKDKEITLKLTPVQEKSVNFGISSVDVVKTNLKYSYYKSMSTVKQIVGSYIELFQGKVKVQQLSGIVGIGEVISKSEGLIEFLNLLGIISLAIGVANVLPFPPLDGGKVVLILVEVITRKKVSQKLDLILSYIGFGLLILLTIFVTVNDIIKII